MFGFWRNNQSLIDRALTVARSNGLDELAAWVGRLSSCEQQALVCEVRQDPEAWPALLLFALGEHAESNLVGLSDNDKSTLRGLGLRSR